MISSPLGYVPMIVFSALVPEQHLRYQAQIKFNSFLREGTVLKAGSFYH